MFLIFLNYFGLVVASVWLLLLHGLVIGASGLDNQVSRDMLFRHPTTALNKS